MTGPGKRAPALLGERGRALMAMGAVLFFLGLAVGLAIPVIHNSRMGLAAHLGGVMNGTFLLVAGLVWQHVRLSPKQETAAYWLLAYGTYANLFFVLVGAILGTGDATPIAGAGFSAEPWQETLVLAGLGSVALTMLLGCGLFALGLVRRPTP